MNFIKIFKSDAVLILFYGLIYALCDYLYKTHPFIETKKDLSGLYYILVCCVFGIVVLICQIVCMLRFNTTAQVKLLKWILMIGYWIISSIIFVLLNIGAYTRPFMFFLIIIYMILLWIGMYFSAFRPAQLTWKDYRLMFLIVFGVFMVMWSIPAILSQLF